MPRRFTVVTLLLTAVIAFLVGVIFAGGIAHSPIVAGTKSSVTAKPMSRRPPGAVAKIALFARQLVHIRLHSPLVFVRPVSAGLHIRFAMRLRKRRRLVVV